jgi:hypothetical protein
MPETLWILTEERPKRKIIERILVKFADDHKSIVEWNEFRITPLLDDSDRFTSTYEIEGLISPLLRNVYLLVISGNSSFVDYLVYFQDNMPSPSDQPIYAIEETKTDDSESRNTGVFQRGTKFVYLDLFFPQVEMSMLYNLQIDQIAAPTQTNIFGTRCFRTLGVQILGKEAHSETDGSWSSIEELIEFKSNMRKPPAGNVPIEIKKIGKNLITVSGRLVKKTGKSAGLSHDPNIGALSLISASLRRLGWLNRIQIVNHGLSQEMVQPNNKFVQIANHLDLELEGIKIPEAKFPEQYWHYEESGEKIGTIFSHLVIEHFSNGRVIYENHAGCERGYFYTPDGVPLAVGKRLKNKDGKMPKDAESIALPDLVVVDDLRKEILNIEGEKSTNVLKGIEQLKGFSNIEKTYFKQHYPQYTVSRSIILFGGRDKKVSHPEVSLLLDSDGDIFLGPSASQLMSEAIGNLKKYTSDKRR